MRSCVCAAGGMVLVTLIIVVTNASPPHQFCHHPCPESVGGMGRMKGNHKGKEMAEGKVRTEKKRVDDGKWPPPQCHMGGGWKESVLCFSYWDAS